MPTSVISKVKFYEINRNFIAALKTAIRLIEYEKDLTTRVVYSLVAIAAGYSGMWQECSKAFVKLENMDGITPEDKEMYENMAIALFSTRPPIEDHKNMINCPGKSCSSTVSE